MLSRYVYIAKPINEIEKNEQFRQDLKKAEKSIDVVAQNNYNQIKLVKLLDSLTERQIRRG